MFLVSESTSLIIIQLVHSSLIKHRAFLICAFIHDVDGETDFLFTITYYSNDYGMVMCAEGYEAVTVAFLTVVLCTHCNPF